MATFRYRDVILTLIATFVSWAWATHWLPSLRLVPYVFVLGIATGIVSVFYVLSLGSRRNYDELNTHFAPATALSFTSVEAWTSETSALKNRQDYGKPLIRGVPPPLSTSLDGVLRLVLRDYVESWYSKISGGQCFANEIDRAIRLATGTMIERVLALDLPYFFVTQILPIINDYLEKFAEAEEAVHGKGLAKKNITDTEELDVAIAARFRNGKLHPGASLASSRSAVPQQQHLRKLVERILPLVLPADMKGSSAVTVIVREMVACAMLQPLMQLLTDPHFLNQQIEAYGHAVLHERKTVKKLRAALDEHASPKGKSAAAEVFPYLSPNDNERGFERFIRAIKHLKTLPNAAHVRREVVRRIEQERIMSKRDDSYLRWLDMGKRLLDQRVQQLSSFDIDTGQDRKGRTVAAPSKKRESVTIRDTLYDASGLAYFMEFMDNLGLMTLVQFWIVVDGFRTPLEKASEDYLEKQSSWDATERQHIANIYERYIRWPELKVPDADQRVIISFLDAGQRPSVSLYNAARRAVVMAQARVFHEMEDEHFLAFQQSDLCSKWMSSAQVAPAPTLSRQMNGNGNMNGQAAQLGGSPTQTRGRSTGHGSAALKSPDLRRAIASSSELSAGFKKSDRPDEPGRSLDDNSARRPLFDDEPDTDTLATSIGSLDSEPESLSASVDLSQTQAVDAVQAALDDIVDKDAKEDSLFGKQDSRQSRLPGLDRASREITRSNSQQPSPLEKPSLASLGLLGMPSKRTVFNSDDLFGDNENFCEDEATDVSADDRATDEDDIEEAAPGHLGLSEVIQTLSLDIDKLEAQQSIVKSLLSKAELTNDAAELRILGKSQTSLTREIRRKELQRQQYIIQENDNTLYGKASIAIKSIMLGTEPDGHEFALYVIEVSRPASGGEGTDKIPAASWAITRRFSEFHSLHKRLRRRFPAVREMDFPRRQMVLTLQKEFIKKRRAALERYLRELLRSPSICRSLELRAFLSQQAIPRPGVDVTKGGAPGQIDRRDFVTRIYNSVTDGMEEFLGNIPVLDQLSVAGQNLISAAATASNSANASPTTPFDTTIPAAIASDPTTAAEARRELSALDDTEAATSASSVPAPQPQTTFIAPLATTFLTLFRLHNTTSSASGAGATSTTSYLRGRAVVIVLQALLGGTVERRVRDAFASYTTPVMLASYVDLVQSKMFPLEPTATPKTDRTPAQKSHTRTEASIVLQALFVERIGGVVGRGTAGEAGARVGRMIANRGVVESLGWEVLDGVVGGVFGVAKGGVGW